MHGDEDMLRVEDVRVQQGDFALSADFVLERGTRTAVLGPSGAGKSTLLGAIGGYLPTITGRILVDGADVTEAPPDRRGIAMLFQDGNLFPHLSLAQNVGLGMRPTLRLTEVERAQVQESLDRVGLKTLADRKPGQISGGQQSRAALARILVQQKPVLLLDEPFAALGPALRREMLDTMSELATAADATVLMITHAPEDAERVSDSVLFVDRGKVDPPRATQEILANPPEALRSYLSR